MAADFFSAYLVLRGSGGPLPCSFFTSSSLLRRKTSLSFPREPLRWRAPLPSCRHTRTHHPIHSAPTVGTKTHVCVLAFVGRISEEKWIVMLKYSAGFVECEVNTMLITGCHFMPTMQHNLHHHHLKHLSRQFPHCGNNISVVSVHVHQPKYVWIIMGHRNQNKIFRSLTQAFFAVCYSPSIHSYIS